jgi:hypothetical protein
MIQQTVEVHWMTSLYISHILHIVNKKHISYIQDAFDPAGVQFKTFPTMAKHMVETMLPEQDAKIHKLCLTYLSQPWMVVNLCKLW